MNPKHRYRSVLHFVRKMPRRAVSHLVTRQDVTQMPMPYCLDFESDLHLYDPDLRE